MNKLDEDKSFEPNKLIVFGYSFDTKYQREISEALNNYSNKKSIDIDMIVRY
jgi:adenine-specific DNA-methyltransferase